MARETLWEGVSLSLAVTVKATVCAKVGVPVMEPLEALIVKPGGRFPLVME